MSVNDAPDNGPQVTSVVSRTIFAPPDLRPAKKHFARPIFTRGEVLEEAVRRN